MAHLFSNKDEGDEADCTGADRERHFALFPFGNE